MAARWRLEDAAWLVLLSVTCSRPIVVAEIAPRDASNDRSADASPGASIGPGLRGEYFDNVDLRGTPVLVRIDPRLNMTWSQIPPGPGVPMAFSARWRAALEAEVTGLHQLRLDSDDGSRLWLDEQLLIDQWKGAPNDSLASVNLIAGRRYAVRAELYSVGGSAHINLRWSAPGLPSQLVPQSRFFTAP